jgi:hypothetical protein
MMAGTGGDAVSDRNLVIPRTADGLPYAWGIWPLGTRRCPARLEPNSGGYWGRCDLARHPEDTEHALERGMLTIRWAVLRRAE